MKPLINFNVPLLTQGIVQEGAPAVLLFSVSLCPYGEMTL